MALRYSAISSVRRFDIIIMNQIFTVGSPLGLERSYYFFKVITFLFIQYGYLSYMHTVQPHKEKIFNKLELLNEYCMIVLTFLMLNFTNILPIDLNFDTKVEYAAIAIIAFMIIVNIFIMLRLDFLKCKNYLKTKKVSLKIRTPVEKIVLEKTKLETI